MIFDYRCPACNLKRVDVYVRHHDDIVKCPQCRAQMSRLFPTASRFNVKVWPTDGVFLENVSSKGKTFHSKKEMVRYARENNLELGYLL